MKRLASFLFLLALLGASGWFIWKSVKDNPSQPRHVRMDFPVEGLVMPADGGLQFEPVPKEGFEVLQPSRFADVLHRHGCSRVVHLVLHLDCQYFFSEDGRVFVMTWGDAGKPPRLVETRQWRSSPHQFTDYRTELLPEA